MIVRCTVFHLFLVIYFFSDFSLAEIRFWSNFGIFPGLIILILSFRDSFPSSPKLNINYSRLLYLLHLLSELLYSFFLIVLINLSKFFKDYCAFRIRNLIKACGLNPNESFISTFF